MEKAQQLADMYKTSWPAILQVVNLALKESHGPNIYNQYKKWYVNHFPKLDRGVFSYHTNTVQIYYSHIALQAEKYTDYIQYCDADYHLRTDGKTSAQKVEALKPIRDWCLLQDKNITESTSMSSLSSRVQAIVSKFSTLVSRTCIIWFATLINQICGLKTISNLNEVEIFGAVLYTGSDPIGYQLSSICSRSENMWTLVNANYIHIQSLFDKLITAIKWVVTLFMPPSSVFTFVSRTSDLTSLGFTIPGLEAPDQGIQRNPNAHCQCAAENIDDHCNGGQNGQQYNQ